MDTVVNWFYQIPNTIYAAITASLITLLGVSLSNRAANKRLITQLAIEADERKQEREINLRKDVYLQTAEELSKAQQYLGSLASSDLSNLQNQPKTLEGFFSATSKIHIVGSDETISAVVGVTRKFSEAMLCITAKSMPLHEIKSDIDILSKLIDQHSSERERCLNEMSAFNLNGNLDNELWATLQANFDFVHEEVAKYVSERTGKWSKHNSYQRELMVDCIKEAIELAELVIPAVASIRRELELPFDEARYRGLMNEQFSYAEDIVKSFLAEIKENEAD